MSFVLFVINGAFSQQQSVVDMQSGRTLDLPLKPPGTEGTVYLNEEWRDARIFLMPRPGLSSEVVLEVPIKLDLKANLIEINSDQGIKILKGAGVCRFEWTDQGTRKDGVFRNCADFKFENEPLQGFCQILSDGKMTLVVNHYIEVLKASYNVALDVGNSNNTLLKKERLYLVIDEKLIEADKGSLISHMADKEDKVKAYTKKKRLKLKRKDDIRELVDYYNVISK